MCHVIVTCRSMLWTLLSIAAALGQLIAFLSTDWLVGFPRTPDDGVLVGSTHHHTHHHAHHGGAPHHAAAAAGEAYRPTLGLYSRCIMLPSQYLPRHASGGHGAGAGPGAGPTGVLCGPYAAHFSDMASGFWQAAAIFLALGGVMLGAVALVSVFSVCVQSVMRKSIFNVCGLLQGIAGLFLIVGLVLYPAGWGSDRVRLYCGGDAAPYRAGLCSMGWAFYAAAGSTALTFLCAVCSAQAEIATSSDKVQEEIEEGKSLICLL